MDVCLGVAQSIAETRGVLQGFSEPDIPTSGPESPLAYIFRMAVAVTCRRLHRTPSSNRPAAFWVTLAA